MLEVADLWTKYIETKRLRFSFQSQTFNCWLHLFINYIIDYIDLVAIFETCCLKSSNMDTHFIGKSVHLSGMWQPPCHFFFLCPQTTCQRNGHELLLLSRWLHFHDPQDWNTALWQWELDSVFFMWNTRP